MSSFIDIGEHKAIRSQKDLQFLQRLPLKRKDDEDNSSQQQPETNHTKDSRAIDLLHRRTGEVFEFRGPDRDVLRNSKPLRRLFPSQYLSQTSVSQQSSQYPSQSSVSPQSSQYPNQSSISPQSFQTQTVYVNRNRREFVWNEFIKEFYSNKYPNQHHQILSQLKDIPDLHHLHHLMWLNLKLLFREVHGKYPKKRDQEGRVIHPNKWFLNRPSDTREHIKRAIEPKLVDFLQNKSKDCSYRVVIIDRSSPDNVIFKQEVGLVLRPQSWMVSPVTGVLIPQYKTTKMSVKKSERYAIILSRIFELLSTNNFKTKREIYYLDQELYDNQRMSDDVVDDIACELHVPRALIRIMSTNKGSIIGDLEWVTKDVDGKEVTTSCRSLPGTIIPNNPAEIIGFKYGRHIKFLLVVEKESTFNELTTRSKVQDELDCIVISGQGYSTSQTKQMVHLIHIMIGIPVLGLFDGDPCGIDIMLGYRYNTRSMAYDSVNLATPALRWIGVLPSDFDSLLKIPEIKTSVTPLTTEDYKKIEDLLERPYVREKNEDGSDPGNEGIRKQLLIMKEKGVKIELQGFSSINANYLGMMFLPKKIISGDWV